MSLMILGRSADGARYWKTRVVGVGLRNKQSDSLYQRCEIGIAEFDGHGGEGGGVVEVRLDDGRNGR